VDSRSRPLDGMGYVVTIEITVFLLFFQFLDTMRLEVKTRLLAKRNRRQSLVEIW
jgi:hypothetical protein